MIKFNDNYLLIIPLFIYILTALFTNNYLDTNRDSARYLTLSKNLYIAESDDSPQSIDTINSKYPTLFPTMLNLVDLFSGNSIKAKKLFVFFNYLLLLAVIFLIYKKTVLPEYFIIAFLLLSTNASLLNYSNIIMSEISFSFFVFSAILLLFRANINNKPLDFYMSVFFICAAFLTRTAGIALIMGVLAWMLTGILRKQQKKTVNPFVDFNMQIKYFYLTIAILSIVTILWLIKNYFSTLNNTDSYANEFLLKNVYEPQAGTIGFYDFIQRILNNFQAHLENIGNIFIFFLNFLFKEFLFVKKIVIGLINIIVFSGVYSCFKKRIGLFEFVFIFYFLIILVWPWNEIRFLIPLIPLLVFYFLNGILFFSKIIKKNKNISNLVRICASVFIVLGIMTQINFLIEDYEKKTPIGKLKDLYEAASIIKKRNNKNEKIVYIRPSALTVLTEKKSYAYPLSLKKDNIIEFLREMKITLILLLPLVQLDEQLDIKYLIPVLNTGKLKFKRVGSFNKGMLIEIEKI